MTVVETASSDLLVGSTVAPPGGALVLGADYRALGVVRSLGRRGVNVWVLREPEEPLAASSRYARRALRWPAGGEEERLCFLENLADRAGIGGWAIVPTSDEAAAFTARHFDRLGARFTHTTPDWEVVRWAYDKRLTYALADQFGVDYPRTVTPGSASAVEHALVEVSFPAVLKPAVKETFNRLTAAKAWLVRDESELRARYAEACTLVEPSVLMVQELVPGDGAGQYSYAALCVEGEPTAAVTARRTRQYPADFGRASTYVETTPCPEIVGPSERLLRELAFTGLIELEYKLDARDHRFKLLDMNPRVWGWHTLCGRAGVDFPYLLWLHIRGARLPRTVQQDGVSWLRLSTDTPTAVREMLGGRLSVREYLRTLRGPRESAIFARDDPLPGLAELPLLGYVLARRVLSGAGV